MPSTDKKLERIFHRPEFRHTVPSFWVVAPEYDIVSTSPESPGEIVVKEARPARPYVPLQEIDLFLSFTRLVARGRPADASILAWVSRYGLLRRADEGRGPIVSEVLNQAPMGVEDFVGEALVARSILELYTDLSEGGIAPLRKRIEALRKKHDRMEPLSTFDYFFVEGWADEADRRGWADEAFLGLAASAHLESAVAEKLQDVRPKLWSNFGVESYGPYQATPSWECPDLVSTIYLQIYIWMTSGVPMLRCAIPTCRTPFPMTRKDKRVCSPTCRSNLRHYPELQRKRRMS